MSELKVDELSEREWALVHFCAQANAQILRRVIAGLGVALLISIGGSTVGWYLTRHESVVRTNAIQESRQDVLRENCLETNSRNRGTLEKLALVAPKNPTPRQLQSLQSTKLLISALVPYRGDATLKSDAARARSEREACTAYAQSRVGL